MQSQNNNEETNNDAKTGTTIEKVTLNDDGKFAGNSENMVMDYLPNLGKNEIISNFPTIINRDGSDFVCQNEENDQA